MTTSSDLFPSEVVVRDSEFQPHLAALGLSSAQEYVQWCAERGYSTRLKKHWRDRSRERFAASAELLARRQKLAKQQIRQPLQTLDGLFAGDLFEQDLTQPPLRLVHGLLVSLDDGGTKSALQQLLRHTQGRTGLFSVQPALISLGEQPGNTYIEGMLALARLHERWLNLPGDWQPPSHNVRRQFTSLAAHLVGKYPVPTFMDSAWFRGSSAAVQEQQEWYLALARGASPRQMSFPIPLTRKMVHNFLRAPQDLLIESALRWGQVLGLGGDVRLARASLGSRIGQCFDHNDFWLTVIRSFAAHPMLDTRHVGPLIDFIHHQRFGPEPVDVGHGGMEPVPPSTDFVLAGQTPWSLLNQMREWHAGLRKGTAKPELKWLSSGISNWELPEDTLPDGTERKWTITELLGRSELFEEGKLMRHCVASYDSSCAAGRSSIWSLSLERSDGQRKRALTIEVATQRKAICQIRGKGNRLPKPQELDLIRRWAAQEQIAFP